MKILMLISVSAFFIFGCSSSRRKDDYKTNELLITFNMYVQAGEYESAANLITQPERESLMKNGSLTTESIRGMKNLKVSTLRKYDYWLDRDNKLIGIANIISGTAEKTRISTIQRKIKLQNRANTTVEKTEPIPTESQKTQIISNPYEKTKQIEQDKKIIPKNTVEIEGFVAPEKVTVEETLSDIEPAEEETVIEEATDEEGALEDVTDEKSITAIDEAPEEQDSPTQASAPTEIEAEKNIVNGPQEVAPPTADSVENSITENKGE